MSRGVWPESHEPGASSFVAVKSVEAQCRVSFRQEAYEWAISRTRTAGAFQVDFGLFATAAWPQSQDGAAARESDTWIHSVSAIASFKFRTIESVSRQIFITLLVFATRIAAAWLRSASNLKS